MSRRLAPLLAVLLLATCAATPVTAQTEIERLQRKADSLARLWKEADALADLADSLARVPVMPPLDTLTVGGLLLVTNQPALIRPAAERAWPVIDSFYGAAAAQLRERPYRLQVITKDSQGFAPRQTWGTVIPGGWDADDVTRLLVAYTPIPTDERYQHWAGGMLTPSSRGARVDLAESYVALVTSHFQIGTQCFTGRIDRCRTVLGLDSVNDPARLYPTFAERQKVARLLYAAYNGAGVRNDLVPCLATSDSSCQAALSKVPFEQLPRPVPQIVRHSLVAEALRIGGREAYTRLMADTLLPIPARLEAAAGMPLDSVIARWQTSVVAARPKPVAMPPIGALVGMGWGAIFGLMALRSSRWRIA